MAEITSAAAGPHKRGSRRSKKNSTRVDLTPMVDLGFLLITFFILTTTWSQPHATHLNMPAKGDSSKLGNNAALTLVALSDNKVFYYQGDLNDAMQGGHFGLTGYGGIGDIIREKQEAMDRSSMGHALSSNMSHAHTTSDVRPSARGTVFPFGGGRKELMLLIKLTPEANYGNLVQLLDETLINQVGRYALEDLSEGEIAQVKDLARK